ncbi:hypothetical protein BE11_47640 [Sorangium cellulosum]|nr:hypothetical protein BE11_47640 [Sorangium cellulosum]
MREETGAYGPGDARGEHDVRALRPGEDRRVLRLGAELLELLALHDSSAAVARAGVEGAAHGRGRRPLERELVECADVELLLLERPERDRCAP